MAPQIAIQLFLTHDALNGIDIAKGHFVRQQNSWMDEYFDFEVIEQYMSSQQKSHSHISETQSRQIPLAVQGLPQIGTSLITPPRSKSIFHNFQKHLLTLLKKSINIKKQELYCLPFGILAYNLWKIFLHCSIPSKKILFIIFGVQANQNEAILRKLAKTVPLLRKVLLRQDITAIEQSQALLRSIVHSKASIIQRSTLLSECKMKDFPMFYSYFQGFVHELSEGVISQRMGKHQKERLEALHV